MKIHVHTFLVLARFHLVIFYHHFNFPYISFGMYRTLVEVLERKKYIHSFHIRESEKHWILRCLLKGIQIYFLFCLYRRAVGNNISFINPNNCSFVTRSPKKNKKTKVREKKILPVCLKFWPFALIKGIAKDIYGLLQFFRFIYGHCSVTGS